MIAEALKQTIGDLESSAYYAEIAGIKRTELASLRTGKRSVSLDTAIRVARAYGHEVEFASTLFEMILEESKKHQRG